jgi:photosystem II stability/assembly factor-like uncharacterized protein
MERINFGASRRGVIAAAIGNAFLLLLPKVGQADAPTGIVSLDTVAIPVRSPATVILIAIARAESRFVAVGEHGVIVYSDDNAETWTQATVPVDVTLTCVAFATPMLGWAAGHFGVILTTMDGGKTWVEQLNGIEANRLTLVAAQAAAAQPDNPSPDAPLALRRANVFVEQGPTIPFLALLILTPQKIIAFGAYRMAMMTADGGRTWTDWSLRIAEKFSRNLYAATTIGSNIYIVGEEGLVFCSRDGGGNFEPITSPSNVTLFGIVGAHDGSIIVFGVAGSCFRSTDGGNSWTNISLGTQDNLAAGYVLRSGKILLGCLSGALYVSHDDGITFSVVTGTPPMSISGVMEASNNSLIVVGYSGVTKLSIEDFG